VTSPIYIPGLDLSDQLAQQQAQQAVNQRRSPAAQQQLANANVSSQLSATGTYHAASTPTNPYDSQIKLIGGKGTTEYDQGNKLLGTLSLPGGLVPDDMFAFSASAPDSHYAPSGNQRGPDGLNTAVVRHTQTLTEMTMAGALSWLRNLAAQSPTQYNEIVNMLWQANYITDYKKVKYGSYTTDIGNAFLKSAADVWSMNQDQGVGQLTTWGDHINALIQARKDAGQIDDNGFPVGSGGTAPQAPTRIDRWSDPETVKAAGNAASKNILGRDLNDAELSQFSGIFHAAEQTFNDQQWAATQQQVAGGGSVSTTDAPNPSASALNYVKTDPGLGAERTEQALGSYLGVLRQMTGLGSGGVSSAIA
jgi:hypothetical protein